MNYCKRNPKNYTLNNQIPSYGTNLEAAEAAYNKIIEAQKEPKPRYETIKTETI